MKETRSFRPFKSSEEYLYAMKEDLAEWLNMLYPELDINVDNFMDRLDTGVALCKHANKVRQCAVEYVQRRQTRRPSTTSSLTELGDVYYLQAAKPGTFFARDNVSNFISWCRRGLCILECLLFETDDLILRKNEKHVILCLLEVARRGAKFGMLAPMLVQLEREIDREIAAEQSGNNLDDSDEDEQFGPMPQVVTNDLKSLDEMVRELVERCTCPVQFPMIRVSEGKYRIGDTKVLIFVRVLRNHVMVRVGGGWDTLSHYLDKHDPCRCKTGHRVPLSTKLILKSNGPLELSTAQVLYERSPPRTRRSSASSVSSGGGLPVSTRNRSRSPSACLQAPRSNYGGSSTGLDSLNVNGGRRSITPTRSRSPTPRLSVTKTTSSYDGNNTRLSTSGRTSRNRSRSPTPRPLSRNKNTCNSPADNNNNEGADTTNTTAPPDQQSLNDSGSEVSDEGYRSLGIVASSAVDGTTIKAGQEELSKPEEVVVVEPEDADHSERPIPTVTTPRPLSECSSCDDVAPSPSRHKRTPSDVQCHRLSDGAPNDTKMTRSRSTGGAPGLFDPGSPARRAGVYRSVRSDPRVTPSKTGQQHNTWSGRQGKGKPRPSLNGSGFERNTMLRRSLGSANSTPTALRRNKGSLPASLQCSPTKHISPLLEQILQVRDLDNDVTVLKKMKEIIQHYADIVDEKLVEERQHEEQTLPQEELDFTSAWVHGNGSVGRIRKVSPSPRKDSKVDGAVSRIPAPVFYRPVASTTAELTTRGDS